MKTLKGNLNERISNELIGIATKHGKSLFARRHRILIAEGIPESSWGYLAILTTSVGRIKKRAVEGILPDAIKEMNEGDVISISPDGTVRILWDIKSEHNCFALTESCNCRCIMCPQPPERDNGHLHQVNKKVLSLLPEGMALRICFTGGEPALFPDRLVELMEISKKKFNDSFYYVLTNGILFSDFDMSKKIALASPPKTLFCVSLHADVAEVHEAMNGASGSFGRVLKGIHNLAKLRQAVEIRPVITKLNHRRLGSMAEFIYRNFPFAEHVAFMGMEIKGEAEAHYDEIWIDPFDYAQALSEAVWELHRRGMNVSIYNIPLCLLPKGSWRFARQSISEWKNDYLGVCDRCSVKKRCCGVFATSGSKQSRRIKPIDIF